MTVEFRILGPLEVVRDGRAVELGPPRERALLALLLTRANVAVSRDRLIDELWPDDPPRSAVNVLQTYVSHLRRALPTERLLTRAPGYLLRVEGDELDLERFERLVEEGRRLLASGEAEAAAEALRAALGLWRGRPLADVDSAGFAAIEAARLAEIRLAALDERIEADLARGRHRELVAELEALVAEHPLRERLRGQLMLALYRSGRQPEALAQYRAARARLAEELGIEPGRDLRELEGAMLRQDAVLEFPAGGPSVEPGRRALLAAALDGTALDDALGLAEPLARHQDYELVLVAPVGDAARLPAAAERTNVLRRSLTERGVHARGAAFTSSSPGPDVVRLASEADAALLLVAAPGCLREDGGLDAGVTEVLVSAPSDVALLPFAATPAEVGDGAPVIVPFGGAEHEWAAAEIGAWLAQAEGRPLRLLGTAEDARADRRDASRLLATVALLVQQIADVPTEPALAAPDEEEFGAVTSGARAVVAGLPDGWRGRGVGPTRAALLRAAGAPVLLVRGGIRPGGLAPPGSMTRFTWTLTPLGP